MASEWTVDSLKAYFDALMGAHNQADLQRHQADHDSLAKSERSLDKRLDSMNEFRAQLADQVQTFLPRMEYNVQHSALIDRIIVVEQYMITQRGKTEGLSSGARVTVAVAGFVLTIVTIVSVFLAISGH